MERTYLCPHCNAHLNPNVKIVLRAQVDQQRALLLFSPQPGNYDVVVPDGFQLRKKDKVSFSCPVCSEDLTSPRDPTMAQIRFTSTNGTKGLVAFSRIFGHHSTYFITAEQVESFGEDADKAGFNFWGVGPDV